MPKTKITNNLDNLSFSKAFAKSRQDLGPGQVFKWKGRRFTTNHREEEARSKTIQDEISKVANDKTLIEGSDARVKENTVLDLNDSIVKTESVAKEDVLNKGEDIVEFIKGMEPTPTPDAEDGPGLLEGISNVIEKGKSIGQNLLNKAGELINFDNDLVESTVNKSKQVYNESKENLSAIAEDLEDIADDTYNNQLLRARNIKKTVHNLTEQVSQGAQSEFENFKNKLNDNFLNKTLLPFINRTVPWGDVDDSTKKIIEDPNSTTETLTDNDKSNLFTLFQDKVIPKINQMSQSVQEYIGETKENIMEQVPSSKREFLNDDLYPMVRDKFFGVLPRPIRQMLVQRANIDGETMTDDEKLGLYMAYKNSVKRGDNMVKYQDYGSDRDLWKQFQGGEENLFDAAKHYYDASDVDRGAYNMMMTIGGEGFREEDGNIIFDKGHYDFNKKGVDTYEETDNISSYGKLRNWMSDVGVTEDDPNRASINISLNRQEMEDQLRQKEEANKAKASANAPFIYQNIPQNIIPLLMKGRQFVNNITAAPSQPPQQLRRGGVRRKTPIENK